MAVLSYTNPGWVNDSAPAVDATNLNAISNALQSLSAGTAWLAPAINSTYIQFPGHTDPATLWPNSTWTNISSETLLAGRVPRIEGSATYGSAAAFGSSQDDQGQGHWHRSTVASTAYQVTSGSGLGLAGSTPSTSSVTDAYTDGVNGTPRMGTETRVASVTIRVWQRTA